jgi:hypothetical protein
VELGVDGDPLRFRFLILSLFNSPFIASCLRYSLSRVTLNTWPPSPAYKTLPTARPFLPILFSLKSIPPLFDPDPIFHDEVLFTHHLRLGCVGARAPQS